MSSAPSSSSSSSSSKPFPRPLRRAPGSGAAIVGSSSVLTRSSNRRGSLLSPSQQNFDVRSTLQQFGYATGFDVQSYMEEYYKTSSVAQSSIHLSELKQRKELVSDELKEYVTNHYTEFIATTKEIVTIENDLLLLNDCLNEYQHELSSLSHIHFRSIDTTLINKWREKEQQDEILQTQEILQTGENKILEEWNEELRGFIYERKFEKAVQLIEIVQEKLKVKQEEEEKERKKKMRKKKKVTNGLGLGLDLEMGTGTMAGGDGSKQQLPWNGVFYDESFNASATSPQPFDSSSSFSSSASSSLPPPSSTSLLASEIQTRVGHLVDMLLFELQSPSLSKNERKQIIQYLIRLKQEEKALNIYLSNRSSLIKQEIRHIKFQGDISLYIQELSQVIFQNISATCHDFLQLFGAANSANAPSSPSSPSFKKKPLSPTSSSSSSSFNSSIDSNTMMSSVMVWSINELSEFGHLFEKQVFHTEGTFSKLGKCLRYAFTSCHDLERKGGLSLSFVLSRMFIPSLLDVIHKNYKHVEGLISDELSQEQWRVTELWVHDKETTTASGGDGNAKDRKRKTIIKKKKRALRLTSSAKYLYDVVRNLLRELVPILDNPIYPAATSELYPAVVTGMISLFEGYLLSMAQQAKIGLSSFDDIQSLSIVANAYYLSDDLLPRVQKEFTRQFKRSIPEMDHFSIKLIKLYEALQDNYVQKRSSYWIKEILKWNKCLELYKTPILDQTQAKISNEWLSLSEYFITLRYHISKCLSNIAVSKILISAIEEIFQTLLEATPWEKLSIGYGGLQQFVMDLKYFYQSSGTEYWSKKENELVEEMIKKAIQQHCSKMKVEVETVKKGLGWIDAVVQKNVNKLTGIGKLAKEEADAEREAKKAAAASAAASTTGTLTSKKGSVISTAKSAASSAASSSSSKSSVSRKY